MGPSKLTIKFKVLKRSRAARGNYKAGNKGTLKQLAREGNQKKYLINWYNPAGKTKNYKCNPRNFAITAVSYELPDGKTTQCFGNTRNAATRRLAELTD